MFINAATRQQISVYSKLTFTCLYPPHLEKWGVQKFFFAHFACESCFVPLTFRIAAPPLYASPKIYHLRCFLKLYLAGFQQLGNAYKFQFVFCCFSEYNDYMRKN